jgi:hypothetical protein
MVHGELCKAVGNVLDLLLLRNDLLVEQIDLLSGYRFFGACGRLAWRRGFATDIIEGILAVSPELRVLEFPCLGIEGQLRPLSRDGEPTFCPYGDWPLSSLFCRTL